MAHQLSRARKRLRGGTEAPPRRRLAPHRSRPPAPPGFPGPRAPLTSGAPPHHSSLKLMATFLFPWLMAVNAEPLTWAVLLWFEAPLPTAFCCVVDELPLLSWPTPLPTMLATPAFDPLSAMAPLSAAATPVNRAAASGRAETAAMTRAVRMLAM